MGKRYRTMLNCDLEAALSLKRENTIFLVIVEALADCQDEQSVFYACSLCERMMSNLDQISLLTGIPEINASALPPFPRGL